MHVSISPGPGAVAGHVGAGRAGAVLARAYRGRRGVAGDAVFLGVVTVLFIGHPRSLAMSLVLPVALAATVPLVAARRFPAASLSLVLAANAVFIVFGRLSWPVPAVVAWLVASGLCPVLLSRRTALAALGSCEAVVALAAFLSSPHDYTPWDATIAEALAVLTAWGVGESLWVRRRSAVEQSAATALVQQLRERDAVARERAAIARELHDVVAHHVSLIAVRAATAPYAQPELAPSARAAFEEIAGQARTALAELRTVLGVLRAGDGGAEQAPQPGLANLPDLVRQVREGGTPVTLTVTGPARRVPGSVELCAYRIVQESLTNTGRHAPGSRAWVELDYRRESLVVTVRDSGSGRLASAGLGAPRAAGGVSSDQVGYGLVGMRERVAVLDGSLEAGVGPDGGFTVSARLPLAAAATAGRAPK